MSKGKFVAGPCHEPCSMVVATGDPVKQDLLHPTVRHGSEEKSRWDFLFFRLRFLPLCHHAPTKFTKSRLLFTKSRFSVHYFSFFRGSRVSDKFCSKFPIYEKPVWKSRSRGMIVHQLDLES